MGKKAFGKGIIIFLAIIMIVITITIYMLISNSPEREAEEAIDAFYAFEQEGSFADSWEMFHPLMKERFEKVDYLQDRPHVFMNDFGVTTFDYTVEDAQEITDWQISEEAEPIDVVYGATVTQMFQGKYGNFMIVQEVFAVEIDDEWKLMWDYNEGGLPG